MLEKLYTIKLPLDDRRKKLYIQGNFIQREEHINIEKGKIVDLGTYFNAFSVKNGSSILLWRSYSFIFFYMGNSILKFMGYIEIKKKY